MSLLPDTAPRRFRDIEQEAARRTANSRAGRLRRLERLHAERAEAIERMAVLQAALDASIGHVADIAEAIHHETTAAQGQQG